MNWNDLPKSALASMVTAKKLNHPTNVNFDAASWEKALAATDQPNERDHDIAFAAIRYGTELANLRDHKIPEVTKDLGRSRLVRVLAAFANQQFLTLRAAVIDKIKKERSKSGVFDSALNQQMLIGNVGGQEMTPDDMVTYLVDSLPHWLFHIWKVQDGVSDKEMEDTSKFAANALATSTIEHSLRHLWLTVLWNGDRLEVKEDRLFHTTADRTLAEYWFIWDQRQHMLLGAEHGFDMGQFIVNHGRVPPVKPEIDRTVIRVDRMPSGYRRYVVGRASGAKAEQRSHVSENTLLEKQYTGLFLDEPLPHSIGGNLTCRQLSRAWWVLQDLVHVEIADLMKRPNQQNEKRLAVTIAQKDLVKILGDALSINKNDARGIVEWLTCDPRDTNRLFSKSFWSEPLLPSPESEYRHILLAPLLAGTPVKRIEAWMEKGGISDNQGIKGRGKPFEHHVRRKLIEALEKNPLITDAEVAREGLKRKGTSEEIDLLVRVGDAVIVGEVKCFVAPSEPLEKYNYLDSLSKATRQCNTKRVWSEENRETIAALFGITDAARIKALKFHPVVVLNNGMGIGLNRNDVPVVDLQYLALILRNGSFVSGSRFERDVGAFTEATNLYTSQANFENTISNLLFEPVVLRRYAGTVQWRDVPFVTSDNRPFFIQLPAATERPSTDLLRDISFRQKSNRNIK